MRRLIALAFFGSLLLPWPASAQETTPAYAPNRVIVQFKEGQSKSAIENQVENRQLERSTFFGRLRQQAWDNTIRLGQKTPEERLERLSEVEDKIGVEIKPLPSSSSAISIAESDKTINVSQAVAEFKTLPEVETAEPDYIEKVTFEPNDYYFRTRDTLTSERYQWSFDNTSVPQAWDVTQGDSAGNVLIAVIDTGITTHQDLASKIAATFDCRSDFGCTSGGNTDIYGHGTAVAGVAAAATNNSSGMAGVGFNTKIIALKIGNDDGTMYLSWSLSALDYLITHYAGQKIIVNMSFGSEYNSQIREQMMNEAWNAGFVLIGAAGNDNTTTRFFPADHASVISVGSNNRLNQKAIYSNYGTWVEVVAPGGDCSLSDFDCMIIPVMSTSGDVSGYSWGQGTSFASPFVSGLAALVWAANPSFTNTQVRSRIESTADAISGTGTLWRYGKVNAYKAVTGTGNVPTAMPTRTPTITPTATPIPGGIGLTIVPQSVSVTIAHGAITKVLDLTSVNQNQFTMYGYPTSFGPGINWSPAGGGIQVGSTIPISIFVSGTTLVGTYQGTGVVKNGSNQQITFPVTVHVVQSASTPSPTQNLSPTPVPGDVTGDGHVTLPDLSLLLSNFGKSGQTRSTGDVTGADGKVDLTDLSLLL